MGKANRKLRGMFGPAIETENQAAEAIVIGFACAGVIPFIVGLITRTRLAMWYTGLLFLLGALAGWFILRRGK